MKIYFYPHSYLRDRQIDTIKQWPREQVLNAEMINKKGKQVSAKIALAPKFNVSWKQKIPLLNIKLRPKGIPRDSVVYVWGGLILTGKFIVDLDNPWSLVGYNLRGMFLYKIIIKWFLLSRRCVEIRCMSMACRESLKKLFGDKVFNKANIRYPYMPQFMKKINKSTLNTKCRFLFVGTQFEIKGGAALLKAFQRVFNRNNNCHLDIITHIPDYFLKSYNDCAGITWYEACFSREEIHSRFMKNSDVLILPTYVETFGMVALEALSYGMAIIATEVYALKEIVHDGKNGVLIQPPVSIWCGVMPSKAYYKLLNIKDLIFSTNTEIFEESLEKAIERFVVDVNWRLQARQASISLMKEKFAC